MPMFMAYSLGIFIGIIVTPLASAFLRFHQGYNLYNVGFTAGIISMLFIGLVRTFGYEVQTTSILYEGDDVAIRVFIIAVSLAFIIYGWYRNGSSFNGIKNLISKSGRLPSDYLISYGLYPMLINMGVVGLLSVIYVYIMGGVFNGPVIGGILSVIAFGAFGKNMKNIIPIFIGVFIAQKINIFDASSTYAIIMGLFGTTLAPIAGEYGFFAGVISGFLHVALVSNIGNLHGGMNLYNNGFSGGFIAGIMIPILTEIRKLTRRE